MNGGQQLARTTAVAVLAQVNTLPDTKVQPALCYRNGNACAQQARLDMRRQVVGPFVAVAVARLAFRHRTIEILLEIRAYRRIGVFIEGQRRRCVPNQQMHQPDIQCRQFREGRDDLPGDQVKAPGPRPQHDLFLNPHGAPRPSRHQPSRLPLPGSLKTRRTAIKNTGTRKMARSVAEIMPPITPVPTARWPAEPAPVANTRGITPMIKASEVIRIGRKRRRQAVSVASIKPLPSCCRLRANSMIRMAFFADRPMMAIRPTLKYTSFGMPASVAPSSEPNTPSGTTSMTEKGIDQLS